MSPAKLQSVLKEGLEFHRAGKWAEAEKCYRQVRVGAPRSFDAFNLSGALAYQSSRAADAVGFFEQALKLDRKAFVCEMHLGLALLAIGRTSAAELHFRNVVRTKPDYAEGWDKLAYCLKTQDRLDEAIPLHQKAVGLNRNFAMGWYNYGLTLVLLGRLVEALACHERALAADPNYALACFGRAQALHQLHRIPDAIAEYGRFIELQPDHHEARSNRLFALHSLEEISREELFAEHVEYGRAVGEFFPPAFFNVADPQKRLRVAILSPDLRNHSCAYFLEPLLAHLDPQKYELYLYHDHFREDEVSTRLRSRASVWRKLVGQSSLEVEKIIRADAPDILIDLAGHTGMGGRLSIFARRLAPVQITYLGYPNTTGIPAMDYRLTDNHADPVGEADAFATEKLVRFAPTAWTYAPPASAPNVSALPADENGFVTFGCFNSFTKLTEKMLRTWSGVLHAVPNSQLLFKGSGMSNPDVRARFLERLARAGLPIARVQLLERTADTESHLAAYQKVDIALDTFPYHGTTTTCESLWMGVPVISLAGDRHMSRVGASLLHAVGRAEWIAETEAGYIQAAVTLAGDLDSLRRVRAGLRGEMRSSALLDHAGQAEHFGQALRDCWQNWCAEKKVPVEVETAESAVSEFA